MQSHGWHRLNSLVYLKGKMMAVFLVDVYEVHKSRRLVIASNITEAKDIATNEGTEVECDYHKLLSDYTDNEDDDTNVDSQLNSNEIEDFISSISPEFLKELKENV